MLIRGNSASVAPSGDAAGVDAEEGREPVMLCGPVPRAPGCGRDGDGSNDAQAVAPVPAAHDGRDAARRPGLAHQWPQHEAGFVVEYDGRVQPPRVFF